MKSIEKLWIDSDGTIVSFGVVFTSLLTYLYYFTHDLLNSDCYGSGITIYSGGTQCIELGCWASSWWYKLTGLVVFPLFNHCVYMICIIISTILICDLWKIKGKTIRALVGMSLMVAPAVVGQIMYNFCYPTFGLAFLCATVSVYLFFLSDRLLHFLVGIAFMALSLGFYSIYLGPLLFLGVGTLILRLSEMKYENFKSFFMVICKCAVFIVAGLSLYYGLMVLHLMIFNTSRSSYAGGDKVGIVNTLLNVIKFGKSTYRKFYWYYRDAKLGGNAFWGLLIILALACVIYNIFKMLKTKNYWAAVVMFILVMAIPPCANVMLMIMPDHGLQLHWIYQMQITAPFCIAVIQTTLHSITDTTRLKSKISYVMAICLAGLVISYSFCAYSSFHTIDFGSRHIKYIIQNALTHAIEDDVHKDNMPIVFLGFVDDDPVQAQNPLLKYSYFERAYPFWRDKYEVFYIWNHYCMYNFGIDIGQITEDQYDAILSSSAYKSMKDYPSSKAYAVIEGCYVILMDRESVRE